MACCAATGNTAIDGDPAGAFGIIAATSQVVINALQLRAVSQTINGKAGTPIDDGKRQNIEKQSGVERADEHKKVAEEKQAK